MPSAFPILFGIIHVPFDSFISQNEGNAEVSPGSSSSNVLFSMRSIPTLQARFLTEETADTAKRLNFLTPLEKKENRQTFFESTM
jgi:hypothetical protein